MVPLKASLECSSREHSEKSCTEKLHQGFEDAQITTLVNDYLTSNGGTKNDEFNVHIIWNERRLTME